MYVCMYVSFIGTLRICCYSSLSFGVVKVGRGFGGLGVVGGLQEVAEASRGWFRALGF